VILPRTVAAVLLTGHGGSEAFNHRRDMVTLETAQFDAPVRDGGVLVPDAPGLGITVNRNVLGDPVAAWGD
jgi:L-alanine-DL-glutamate epimerase-like enolase superfamily enzyme